MTIVELKYFARRHFEEYRRAIEHLDCGAHMAQMISTDAAHHAREFDRLMDELRKRDPDCPDTRLSA